jgi:hypothetical protein
MALVLKDRVLESSTSTGTGTFTLTGAQTGYQSFTVIGNGNTTYYTIQGKNPDGTLTGEWEVGEGTWSTGNTLARNTVFSNSLGTTAKIAFSAGDKDVFVTYPSDKALLGTTSAVASTGTGSVVLSDSPTFTTAITSTGALQLTGSATVNQNIATDQTSGTLTVGGASATGAITLGRSTGNQTVNIATGVNGPFANKIVNIGTGGTFSNSITSVTIGATGGTGTLTFGQNTGTQTTNIQAGATASGSTKTMNIGTGGLAGSTTNIAIGATAGTSTTTLNGTVNAGGTSTNVNFHTLTGSPTTKAIEFDANGSDSNISMAFMPKGTGAIDLAAGSSGVNISNGGTVTAITRTAAGSAYTTPPTVAISAPTTAGGVQATASANMFFTTATIVSGGTGYTVGDVLTFSGGTFVAAAQVTVATVSSGVITSVTGTTSGLYSVTPANPVSVTGGSGTGATFTVNYAVNTFTITNAGSGYIEQPTVTFSGGGGSGATAYASVGSSAIFKGLAGSGSSSFSFFSPAGEALRIHDVGGSAVNYLRVQGGVAGNTPVLLAAGSDGSVTLALRTQGTGSVSFQTGGVTQAVVSHTASAVNYVQVTGSATGGRPVISTQGSDGNAGMNIQWKGQANMFFLSGNGAYTQFRILGTNNAVNNIAVTGTVAGSAPFVSAEGTDTDIDLSLTPKGTGRVRFGTYTASILTPTGYIEVKDSGGTVRRLLVG